jgi:beta-glucosidase
MVPATANPLDKVSAGIMDVAQNRLYADPVLLGQYPDLIRAATFFSSSFSPSSEDMALISQPLDFYGLNYYMPTRVGAGPGEGAMPQGMAEAMGEDLNGAPGAFHLASFPDTETTAYGWPIKPEYMSVALAEMAERYPGLPPVYITEGGASFEDIVVRDAAADRRIVPDERRLRYLADHIRTALEATRAGGAAEAMDLRGYYVWSFLDNFEWSAGYKQPFGLVHVDFDTRVRTPKASYYWLQEVIAARNTVTADVGQQPVTADVERPLPAG